MSEKKDRDRAQAIKAEQQEAKRNAITQREAALTAERRAQADLREQ